MKHTPGPWRINDAGEVQDDFGVTLAFLVGPGRNSEADGRLMAAAPELLKALERCVAALNRQPGAGRLAAVNGALAAIAKAERT